MNRIGSFKCSILTTMQQNKMQTIRGGTQNYVLSKKVFLKCRTVSHNPFPLMKCFFLSGALLQPEGAVLYSQRAGFCKKEQGRQGKSLLLPLKWQHFIKYKILKKFVCIFERRMVVVSKATDGRSIWAEKRTFSTSCSPTWMRVPGMCRPASKNVAATDIWKECK